MGRGKIPREILQILDRNGFDFLRQGANVIYRHRETGRNLVFSLTPRNPNTQLKQIKHDIKRVLGEVA